MTTKDGLVSLWIASIVADIRGERHLSEPLEPFSRRAAELDGALTLAATVPDCGLDSRWSAALVLQFQNSTRPDPMTAYSNALISRERRCLPVTEPIGSPVPRASADFPAASFIALASKVLPSVGRSLF